MLELTSELWDCERRGLWAGPFPWLHPEGLLGLGSVGNQAGPPCQGSCVQQGALWGDSGREAVSGLALGQAALWLQPLPLHSTLPACGAALPWCWWGWQVTLPEAGILAAIKCPFSAAST